MLTETDIFDRMKTELRSAVDSCQQVARRPESGVHFIRLRASLKLVEGTCRQAAHWRQDARWLTPGLQMEMAHQKAREWLHRPTVESKKLFATLAAVLKKIHDDLAVLQHARTGRVGHILPKLTAPASENRPVQVSRDFKSSGGIILPQMAQ